MKTRLYTVESYFKRDVGPRRKGDRNPPRFDLQPMTHAQARAFVRNCTTETTGYGLVEWPANVPHPEPEPQALIFYTKSRKRGLQVGQWFVDNRIPFTSILYGKGERFRTEKLTPEQMKRVFSAFPSLRHRTPENQFLIFAIPHPPKP
jgi:hypothetical protein